MAGKNLTLQAGDILFEAGDRSDGMYIVRQGELQVFLNNQGTELILAHVLPGGMIGEMALFDHKNRSASVKAIQATEVTHISTQDFQKLMKQIPKWFTSLMTTLSSRLRDANDKISALSNQSLRLDSPAKEHTNLRPEHLRNLEKAQGMLASIQEIMQTEGEKVGETLFGYKAFHVSKDLVYAHLEEKFKFSKRDISKIFAGLERAGIAKEKEHSFEAISKSIIGRFLKFLEDYIHEPDMMILPPEGMALLDALERRLKGHAYENFVISFKELRKDLGKPSPQELENLERIYGVLDKFDREFKTAMTDEGPGFRVHVQSFKTALSYHRILHHLHYTLCS